MVEAKYHLYTPKYYPYTGLVGETGMFQHVGEDTPIETTEYIFMIEVGSTVGVGN